MTLSHPSPCFRIPCFRMTKTDPLTPKSMFQNDHLACSQNRVQPDRTYKPNPTTHGFYPIWYVVPVRSGSEGPCGAPTLPILYPTHPLPTPPITPPTNFTHSTQPFTPPTPPIFTPLHQKTPFFRKVKTSYKRPKPPIAFCEYHKTP